jgi:two-component system, OmpR family, sensor histidine kinase KdpD
MILPALYFLIVSLSVLLIYKTRQIGHSKEEKTRTVKLYNAVFSSLSHELRTPIATIIGAADNLLTEPSLLSTGDSKRLIEEISAASLRLSRQVDNLLNMSRIESGSIQLKKDWCNVQELVYSTVQALGDLLESHRLHIGIEDDLPLVRLDDGLMEQVLYNLLYNASLYTPEASLINILADCRGGCLEIVVEDNGGGFPEKEIGRVFEKFYRPGQSLSGGAGLGLSLVKGFVEAHNGTISLSNRKTGGARFVISLPVEKPTRPTQRTISKLAGHASC